MADPLNPSFEIAGPNPGEAQNWTTTIVFHGAPIADFSAVAGTANPLESFDQIPFYWTVENGIVAKMDEGTAQGTLDQFLWWSGNTSYRTALTSPRVARFADQTTLETFNEWAAGYVTAVVGGSSFTDTFDATAPTYVTTVTGGLVATFYQGTKTIESFQNVQPDAVFSVPIVENNTLIFATPHGFDNGMQVTVRTTGAPPGGLTTNAVYYVIFATTTRAKLAFLAGGSAITLTSAGVGKHWLHADETLYWTDPSDL